MAQDEPCPCSADARTARIGHSAILKGASFFYLSRSRVPRELRWLVCSKGQRKSKSTNTTPTIQVRSAWRDSLVAQWLCCDWHWLYGHLCAAVVALVLTLTRLFASAGDSNSVPTTCSWAVVLGARLFAYCILNDGAYTCTYPSASASIEIRAGARGISCALLLLLSGSFYTVCLHRHDTVKY